jgi:UDP-N-acetylglucosamine--N-acetylmuramyl-(pentapeptide) pyrophosphoryl-undecaprenol N-acetylglucosamine transferase
MIQEQNVLPGLANRLAERYADRVFIAFPEAAAHFKDKDKLLLCGNPVRPEFFQLNRAKSREELGIPAEDTAIFIFGGSQGAARINEAAIDVIKKLGGGKGYTILFATGPNLYEEVLAGIPPVIAAAEPQSMDGSRVSARDDKGSAIYDDVKIMDYADPIMQYYAASDLIVSRAGALTVSEIAAAGRASILVPSPNVVNNHQYYNAKALGDLGAALLLEESDIADGGLADWICQLSQETGKLGAMGAAAKQAAKPDAVKVIVDELYGIHPA